MMIMVLFHEQIDFGVCW